MLYYSPTLCGAWNRSPEALPRGERPIPGNPAPERGSGNTRPSPRTYGALLGRGVVSRGCAHLRRAYPGLFPSDRPAVVYAPREWGVSSRRALLRARPGHPAGARAIVGRSHLGASPEAIKAVPRLRGAHGCCRSVMGLADRPAVVYAPQEWAFHHVVHHCARGPDTLREPEQLSVAPTSGQAPRQLKLCPASAGRLGDVGP